MIYLYHIQIAKRYLTGLKFCFWNGIYELKKKNSKNSCDILRIILFCLCQKSELFIEKAAATILGRKLVLGVQLGSRTSLKRPTGMSFTRHLHTVKKTCSPSLKRFTPNITIFRVAYTTLKNQSLKWFKATFYKLSDIIENVVNICKGG